MKIYIFGANGMLGRYLSDYLTRFEHNVVRGYRVNFDILNDRLDKLDSLNLDLIVNCAGIIPQRKGYSEREMIYVNAIFPNLLHQYCQERKIKFLHITTDCVFSGNDGNYDEKSLHDATTLYGISKSLGEKHGGMTIRTSIIGEEKENKLSLLEWVKSNQGGEINGFGNHYWNGVCCYQLSKIIGEIVEKDISWEGVRHLYSPTSVSKYQLVSMINEIYDLGIKINQVENERNDKTLTSLYPPIFEIPELEEQIKEQRLNF